MQIQNSVVLVTGANRGLGKVFAQVALERGARKVYAAARQPASVDIPGVEAIGLDVTDVLQVRRAAELAGDVTIVINNAGISLPGAVLDAANNDALRRQLDTHLFGILHMAQTFAPVIERNGGGAIVNMLSALSWIHASSLSGYCVSKSAAWMLSNAMRNELRPKGIQVVGVHAGFIDTDMARGFSGPKTAPGSVAHQAFDAVASGQAEVLADEPARRSHAGLSAGAYLQPLNLG
jgi:NAD(P)-dependent dehydrogenase (short-subunit alcohol dehydrogenase family)